MDEANPPAYSWHVKITLSCRHCKNSSTHALVPTEVASHAQSYYEHHVKCEKQSAPEQ
jgi:hypothetical protein